MPACRIDPAFRCTGDDRRDKPRHILFGTASAEAAIIGHIDRSLRYTDVRCFSTLREYLPQLSVLILDLPRACQVLGLGNVL